jgi:DNA-binding response OmpR family regulator
MSKILIVEDEVAIAELEKDYLELSGFEVEVENDGMTGLARALAEEFDLSVRHVKNIVYKYDYILIKLEGK